MALAILLGVDAVVGIFCKIVKAAGFLHLIKKWSDNEV